MHGDNATKTQMATWCERQCKKLEVTGNHVSKRYTFSSIPNTGEGVNRKIDEPIYF